MEIYSVINSFGDKVGNVKSDNKKLYLTNKSFINKYDNIEEMFDYIESNKLHLIDNEGDLYTREIHNELIKTISRIGKVTNTEKLNILQIIREDINSLNSEMEKIEEQITSIFSKNGIGGLEKINELNHRIYILQAQIDKLYGILGKCKARESF